MSNQRLPASRFWLNPGPITSRLEERNLNLGDFADELGISRSYWSQLLHRKRPLTPQVRRWLLASRTLQGLTAAELWDREPCGGSS